MSACRLQSTAGLHSVTSWKTTRDQVGGRPKGAPSGQTQGPRSSSWKSSRLIPAETLFLSPFLGYSKNRIPSRSSETCSFCLILKDSKGKMALIHPKSHLIWSENRRLADLQTSFVSSRKRRVKAFKKKIIAEVADQIGRAGSRSKKSPPHPPKNLLSTLPRPLLFVFGLRPGSKSPRIKASVGCQVTSNWKNVCGG